MRCNSCKKERNGPLSHWERFKLWLAKLLHDDIQDITADAFTSGFGDGYKRGFEDAKERSKAQVEAAHQLLADTTGREIPLDFQVDLHEVVDVRKQGGKLRLFIGGFQCTDSEVKDLKAQATLLQPTRLWRIMQETVKQKAIEKAVIDSKTWEETLSGKMMLHDLGLLRSIVDAVEKAETD